MNYFHCPPQDVKEGDSVGPENICLVRFPSCFHSKWEVIPHLIFSLYPECVLSLLVWFRPVRSVSSSPTKDGRRTSSVCPSQSRRSFLLPKISRWPQEPHVWRKLQNKSSTVWVHVFSFIFIFLHSHSDPIRSDHRLRHFDLWPVTHSWCCRHHHLRRRNAERRVRRHHRYDDTPTLFCQPISLLKPLSHRDLEYYQKSCQCFCPCIAGFGLFTLTHFPGCCVHTHSGALNPPQISCQTDQLKPQDFL